MSYFSLAFNKIFSLELKNWLIKVEFYYSKHALIKVSQLLFLFLALEVAKL